MSKFVMLDRFSETLGVAKLYPGIPVPRKICLPDYVGTGLKVSNLLENHLILLLDIRQSQPP
jgi:hypothetical protein